MKIYFILILVIGCQVISYSQNAIEETFPTKDGRIFYQEVIAVDSSLTSSDLYISAKTWVTNRFVSGKSVTQTDDKDAGLIIAKAYFPKRYNNLMDDPEIWYTLKIELKNGRYRFTLYDVRYLFSRSAGGQIKYVDKPLEDWLDISEAKISDSKRKKLYEKSLAFCEEIESSFNATISSMKESMGVTKEEW